MRPGSACRRPRRRQIRDLVAFRARKASRARIWPPGDSVAMPDRRRLRPIGARVPPARWQDPPMTRPAHPRVAEVAELLAAAGAAGQVRELPGSARTAAEAAAGLGVPLGAIANSLVFDVAGAPLLVLTSGAHRVDETQVAGLLGVPRVARASADFVRRHTGMPIGGVAPLGHPEPIGT